MDRLEAMSVLLAVVAAGSLSGASRRLRMPLPTVSRKISELEAHLRATLLVRSTRKLALTDAGQSYVAACKRILDEVAEAELDASGEYSAPRGELWVTAPLVFGRLHVMPIAAQFLQAYPEVDVHLTLSDRPLDLIDEHLDLAVRIGTPRDSRLVAARVGRIRSVVCASPHYLEQRGIPKSPEDIAKHDCITFVGMNGSDSWIFRAARPLRVHSRLTVNTAETAVDAAILGLGLTRVLSYQTARAVQEGTLTLVLEKFEPTPHPVNLIYLPESRLKVKLRAFIDFALPRLRTRLSVV
jgi:DNA-binding transcriptional LysR family regulator